MRAAHHDLPRRGPSIPSSARNTEPHDRVASMEGNLESHLRDYMLEAKLSRLQSMQELICELLHKNQLLRMKLAANGAGGIEASKDAKE
jgi:hypothetical protein